MRYEGEVNLLIKTAMGEVIYERVFEELSKEEDKTAQLLSKGRPVDKTASIKFRARGTVNAQKDSVYKKLGVNNTSELTWRYAERRKEQGRPLESDYIRTSIANYERITKK